MIPAATALAKTSAKSVKRLSYVFMPMGCDHSRWTPKGDSLDELPMILESLAPVRNQVNIISNLELANAYPGSHATSNAAFLSCAEPSTPKAPTTAWVPPPIKSRPNISAKRPSCLR